MIQNTIQNLLVVRILFIFLIEFLVDSKYPAKDLQAFRMESHVDGIKKDQEYLLHLACWQKTKHTLVIHILYFSRFGLFSKYSDKILVFHDEFDPIDSYLSSFVVKKQKADKVDQIELYAAVSRSKNNPPNARQKNSVLKVKFNSERFV